MQRSAEMEPECASYCSSLDAICEESEMIAHLQSMFWSSSDADPNLCSCNSSLGLPSSSPFSVINNESYDTMALVNSSPNISFDHQVDALVSENEMNIGIKRKVQMDEQKGHDKEVCTALSAPRKTGTIVVQSSKSRASNQSAKDSQSRYAKKRRHMINERLRILQELIPNGTKVDISTMLQEAVQYVKFLHLQIKLLSSDEMWMYAPLAYNGINISLLHLNSPAQERQE